VRERQAQPQPQRPLVIAGGGNVAMVGQRKVAGLRARLPREKPPHFAHHSLHGPDSDYCRARPGSNTMSARCQHLSSPAHIGSNE
jgi:hypothetical protein